MRLVLIMPQFPRLSETFIASQFAGLVDAGWDAHIVCQQTQFEDWDKFTALKGRYELKDRVHQQGAHESQLVAALLWLPVFLSTGLRAPRASWKYLRRAWRSFGIRSLKYFYLDAAIIALAPDIVHFEFGAGAVGRTHLKRLLDCYLSASFRGYDLTYAGLEDPRHYQSLWETADAIHLLGSDLWRRALERGCPPEMPHALIPPAIDSSYFMSEDVERDPVLISEERPLRIVSVGRLEWVKGYEYALEALRQLREMNVPFEYHIIGGGSYLEPLAFARYQLALEAEVHFLGGQAHAVVMDEMKWADVFLHAAVSEGFCNAVLEAQAMRLPVVCSDAGGLRENVVDGVTGLIVPRRDPKALAQKLYELAGDPDRRRTMGNAGRERVQRCFQLSDQIVAFDKFFHTMTEQHAH